jgi:hypothetical protein
MAAAQSLCAATVGKPWHNAVEAARLQREELIGFLHERASQPINGARHPADASAVLHKACSIM